MGLPGWAVGSQPGAAPRAVCARSNWPCWARGGVGLEREPLVVSPCLPSGEVGRDGICLSALLKRDASLCCGA